MSGDIPQLRLMGVSEVATCLGVSVQRVHVLRGRPGFPKPAVVLMCGIIWLAGDIEHYAATRRRTPGRPGKRTE